MRLAFAIMLIVSLAGMAACDAAAKDWKTCAIGVLFAACNILIFLVK